MKVDFRGSVLFREQTERLVKSSERAAVLMAGLRSRLADDRRAGAVPNHQLPNDVGEDVLAALGFFLEREDFISLLNKAYGDRSDIPSDSEWYQFFAVCLVMTMYTRSWGKVYDSLERGRDHYKDVRNIMPRERFAKILGNLRAYSIDDGPAGAFASAHPVRADNTARLHRWEQWISSKGCEAAGHIIRVALDDLHRRTTAEPDGMRTEENDQKGLKGAAGVKFNTMATEDGYVAGLRAKRAGESLTQNVPDSERAGNAHGRAGQQYIRGVRAARPIVYRGRNGGVP